MSNMDDAYVHALHEPSAKADRTSLKKTFTCKFCEPKNRVFSRMTDLSRHMKSVHPDHPGGGGLQVDPSNRNRRLGYTSNNSSPQRSPSQVPSSSDPRVREASVNADAGGSRSPSNSVPSDDGSKSQTRTKRRLPEEPSPARLSKNPFVGAKPITGPPQEVYPGSPTVPLGLRPEDIDNRFKRQASGVDSSTSILTEPTPRSSYEQPASTSITAQHSGTGLATNVQSHGKRGPRSSAASRNQQVATQTRGTVVQRYKHNPSWPGLVLQPESREISQEQLAAEVKSIYTGLTMVETKCIHIDKAQAATPRSESKITDEHWQAMIALHRTLLHEHHDFFLASQHPSASHALKRLALKYSMPARMWKHGIHSFLELLRHRLPESLEYMLAFIYLAYQMMALLYETVDSFRTTWVECLGDLGRYRMAVEDEDIRDRETWAGVARSWYNKAADTNPAIGRLWHHLAILARPQMVQQVYLYNRSLTSIVPFLNARESIVTIFDPALAENPKLQISAIDLDFLQINALLFRRSDLAAVSGLIQKYVQQLDSTIGQLGDRWRETGAFTVIAIVGTLYEFGNQSNVFRFLADQYRKRLQLQDPTCAPQGLPEDQSVQELRSLPEPDELSRVVISLAIDLFVSTISTALSRRGDKNILSLLHPSLAFLLHLYDLREGQQEIKPIATLLNTFDWQSLCSYLNTLISTEENIDPRFNEFILFEEGGRPLPEDWMLRGLSWTFAYCPRDWYKNAAETEETERYIELTSTMKARTDRVLSLAASIARVGTHMRFDSNTSRFIVPGGDVDMVDEGYGSVLGEDSPEMEEAREDDLRAQHNFQKKTAIGASTRLSQQYSSIITSADVLMDTSLFEGLRRTPLPIIVPEKAIIDLLQSEKEHSVKSNEAAVALSNVRTALQDSSSNIRIETDDGHDVTKKYIESPSAFTLVETQPPAQFVPKGPLQRVRTMYEAIESIARRETDMSLSRTDTGFSSNCSVATTVTNLTETEDDEYAQSTLRHTEKSRPRPLLITDNKQLRAQADKFGAAALAGWLAKRWLEQGRRRSAATALQTSVSNAMEIDATAPDVPTA